MPLRVRLGFIAALLLVASWACNDSSSPGHPAEAWQVLDLTRIKPAFRKSPEQKPGARPYRRVETYLGAQEVRNLELVPLDELERVPELSAGLIDALRQHSGSGLQWQIDLGKTPYFSFVPLVDGDWAASTEYRVFVISEEGERRQLLAHLQQPSAGAAPETQVVDLSAWQQSSITLLLEAEVDSVQNPKPPATWGSPTVAFRQGRTERESSSPPSILLFGIDTLRADHLGPWGRDPSLTPAIDALADESDVWMQAFSCFNVTNPSFASLFTGLYGKNHGVYGFQKPLSEEHETLAELLLEAGYSTRAILSAKHLQGKASGLAQGFQEMVVPTSQRSAEMAASEAMHWIGNQEGPFFLWLHLFDPHTPHTPPAPYAMGMRPEAASGLEPTTGWAAFRTPGEAEFTDPVLMGSRALYEGEIAYVDRQIDKIMAFLESRDLLENTIVVLIADHGENLEEHGVTYRHAGLYDSTTHVPLMIRWPGRKSTGRQISGMVQNIDVFPTLLRAVGIESPEVDGVDLLELSQAEQHGRPVVFAEPAFGNGAMIRIAGWKYFEVRDVRITPKGNYLFDLENDPKETENLAGKGLEIETRLAGMLARWSQQIRTSHSAEAIELEEQDLETLRALGYL